MSKIDRSKTERVQVRLDSRTKRLLERASSLANTTVSAFVVNSALDAASRLIRDRERIVLSDRDWDIFYRALVRPRKPNAALRKAVTLHKRQIVRGAGD